MADSPLTAQLNLIARKLTELNDSNVRCGRPPLQLEDWTWEQRAFELRSRVNLLAADGPNMELLAATGAHIVAAMLALDHAEVLDPASGAEAA